MSRMAAMALLFVAVCSTQVNGSPFFGLPPLDQLPPVNSSRKVIDDVGGEPLPHLLPHEKDSKENAEEKAPPHETIPGLPKFDDFNFLLGGEKDEPGEKVAPLGGKQQPDMLSEMLPIDDDKPEIPLTEPKKKLGAILGDEKTPVDNLSPPLLPVAEKKKNGTKCIVLLSTKEAKKTGSDEQSGLKRKHNLDTRFNEKCQNSENKDGCICPVNMKCISDNAGQTNNYYCEEVTAEKEVDSYTDGKFDWEPKVYVSKED